MDDKLLRGEPNKKKYRAQPGLDHVHGKAIAVLPDEFRRDACDRRNVVARDHEIRP
jgi:hypothetical protein